MLSVIRGRLPSHSGDGNVRGVSERVVVTGLGVVSPLGTTVEEFAARLISGSSAVTPVTTFDVSTCAARSAATVTGFEPTKWIAPLRLRRLDVTSQYAVAIARQALDAAGIAYGGEPDDAAGVVLGTYTAGGSPTEEFLEKLFRDGPVNVPTLIFNATVGNIAASITGLELKLRGPNVTISQKEASGLLAIGHAVDLLRTGQARVLVSGGVDALYPCSIACTTAFASCPIRTARPRAADRSIERATGLSSARAALPRRSSSNRPRVRGELSCTRRYCPWNAAARRRA